MGSLESVREELEMISKRIDEMRIAIEEVALVRIACPNCNGTGNIGEDSPVGVELESCFYCDGRGYFVAEPYQNGLGVDCRRTGQFLEQFGADFVYRPCSASKG